MPGGDVLVSAFLTPGVVLTFEWNPLAKASRLPGDSASARLTDSLPFSRIKTCLAWK